MNHRLYVSVADFRAPFDSADLQGVGATPYEQNRWPRGRSYWNTSNFLAPYDEGYYQNNSLQGVGQMIESVACPEGGAGLSMQTPEGMVMICPNDPRYAAVKAYHSWRAKMGQPVSGLGLPTPPAATLAAAVDQAAPPDVKRYLLAGEPVPTTMNDLALPFNQIPRWGYAVLSLFTLGVAYASYKRFKKQTKSAPESK